MTRTTVSSLLVFAMTVLLAASSTAQDRPVLIYTADEEGADTTAEADVRAAVVSLFDAMREADTTAARAVFHPRATLQSVLPTPTGYRIAPGGIGQFIAALGQPRDAVWDERIGSIRVELDDGLAHAWMSYVFYLGDDYSHCGVNSIQLALSETGWQILNVVDTRRVQCE